MHRAPLIKKLYAYTPLNRTEAIAHLKILNFVLDQPQCFERSLLTGHITASAVVINEDKTSILLTHHKKLNRWLQLGGHADGENNLLNVALREAQEESGIKKILPLSENIFDLDVHYIPRYKNEPEHFHYDIRFLFEANDQEPLIVSHESKALAWIPINEISNYNQEESLLRLEYKLQNNFQPRKILANSNVM